MPCHMQNLGGELRRFGQKWAQSPGQANAAITLRIRSRSLLQTKFCHLVNPEIHRRPVATPIRSLEP